MTSGMGIMVYAIFIGTGATAVLDLWAVFLKRVWNIPSADWRMVGRWVGHFPQGRFIHGNIANAPPVGGEFVLGWAAHYLIGILFAAALLMIWGLDWARQPTFLPALVVGLATLIAPFLIMQPGMGSGVAASKTRDPNGARLRSILAHMVFGVGLYISALLITALTASL